MTSSYMNGENAVAVCLRMAFILVFVMGVISARGPHECREKYETWMFYKKFSELECHFRYLRCLATYCKNRGTRYMSCIARYSVPIQMTYFKKNPFE
ncbi:hypothetical protein ScPMuIL_016219 [Solemya velum]